MEPVGREEQVQESGAGNLDTGKEGRFGERRPDGVSDLARRPTRPGGERQRDVRREVAVVLLLGRQQLRLGQLSVDPQPDRGRTERLADQREQPVLDHVASRSPTRRRTSATMSAGSNGFAMKSISPRSLASAC